MTTIPAGDLQNQFLARAPAGDFPIRIMYSVAGIWIEIEAQGLVRGNVLSGEAQVLASAAFQGRLREVCG